MTTRKEPTLYNFLINSKGYSLLILFFAGSGLVFWVIRFNPVIKIDDIRCSKYRDENNSETFNSSKSRPALASYKIDDIRLPKHRDELMTNTFVRWNETGSLFVLLCTGGNPGVAKH